MRKILCSTGAVIGRPNGRDYTLLEKCQGILECDGYEFLMYDTWYDKIDDIKMCMSDFQKPVPVFHIEKSVGDLISRNQPGDTEKSIELFKTNCLLAKFLGSQKLVLHLWSGLDSDKNMSHNIEVYKFLREIIDAYDLSLTVENVVCNNSDPMSHLKTLAKIYPDIEFTFDTKMAAFHDQMDLLYLKENRHVFEKIKHIHINDYSGGYKEWKKLSTLHVGDGHIDFDKFFAFINRENYCGDFTVEATSFDDDGTIDYAALNRTFLRIRNYLHNMEAIELQKVDKGTPVADDLLNFVKDFSWQEVKEHTVRVLENWEFEEWETPFAAIVNGQIVGMVTIMKSDYYPLPEIYPWISTLFVSEKYRGNRISGKLIEFANQYARELGFDKTYIPTEYTGLYEKYGYHYIKDIVNYANGIDRLYVKELR